MHDEPPLTPTRPYLIRAFYEWIVDNNLTPYLVVDAKVKGVDVPREYVQDDRITLNVSSIAVQALQLGNDWIEFNARFAGRPRMVHCPVHAVMAIYARENGQGMVFAQPAGGTSPPNGGGKSGGYPPSNRRGVRPTLKVVK